MNIGLMGFELKSPNKGCEALSYSIVDFLHREYSNNQICIFVWDTELGAFADAYPNIGFVYVSPRLKDPKLTWIRTIMKCDYIFDVTMGDSFSDIYSEKYCSKLIRRKQIVEFFNKKYILLPQTYGPYNKLIRKKATGVIKHIK